jgi:hypothetical protein
MLPPPNHDIPECPPHKCTNHAFIYNITPHTIAAGEDIPFDSNGSLTSAFIHNYGSPVLIVKHTGVYKITYSVSADISNQIAIYVNNYQRWGTIYGITAGYQNIGQVVANLSEGDVLSVRNISAGPIQLTTFMVDAYGTVNASMLLEEL